MERGQFFSIDVFIAAVILISGTVVLLFSISGSSDLQSGQLFSGDLLRETLTKSVRELNYPVLTSPDPSIGYADPTNPYDIKNFDYTLGEVIGEYHHLAQASTGVAQANYTSRRGNITMRTIAPLIGGQYSYRINLRNETSVETISARERIPFDESEYRVASRSIVAGIDRNREFFGPITVEVIVWN